MARSGSRETPDKLSPSEPIMQIGNDWCGNAYIREEPLSTLLGEVVQRIQIPTDVADWIADGLRDSQKASEQTRQKAFAQLIQRHSQTQNKLDRSYEDYVEGKISEAFWTRKSGEWESELAAIDAELSRLAQPTATYRATGEKILEVSKQAGFLYHTQSPGEQRRLLDTVLSNCTFDRGTLCPTYSKPFDLLVQGNETQNWRGVWDEFRSWLIHAA